MRTQKTRLRGSVAGLSVGDALAATAALTPDALALARVDARSTTLRRRVAHLRRPLLPRGTCVEPGLEDLDGGGLVDAVTSLLAVDLARVERALGLHRRETLVEELDVARRRVGDVLREGPRAAGRFALGARACRAGSRRRCARCPRPRPDRAGPRGAWAGVGRRSPRADAPSVPRSSERATPTRAAPRSSAQTRRRPAAADAASRSSARCGAAPRPALENRPR